MSSSTTNPSFSSALAAGQTLVIDGAMGTQLFAVGLESGDPPEQWNITAPEKIAAIHEAYFAAGSDIVLTNSFGGTCFRLKLHKLDDRVVELSSAAASIARGVADQLDRPAYVAGSMGPSGELLVPMGEMTEDACRAAFAEQAKGLAEGGADLLWIETMSDLTEVTCAVQGAQQACDLPIAVTLSFDTAGRTMMGVTGTAAAEQLVPLGIAALGVNCGNNLADSEAAVEEIRAADSSIAIIAKANAGIPIWKGASLEYSGTPEVMAAHAARVRDKGASIIGACCGSGPDHIEMISKVLSGAIPVPEVEVEEAAVRAEPRRERSRRRRDR